MKNELTIVAALMVILLLSTAHAQTAPTGFKATVDPTDGPLLAAISLTATMDERKAALRDATDFLHLNPNGSVVVKAATLGVCADTRRRLLTSGVAGFRVTMSIDPKVSGLAVFVVR